MIYPSIVVITQQLCKVLDSVFSFLNSTFFHFDSTFWLDSMLKLNYDRYKTPDVTSFASAVRAY